jgi:GGDEF domain-containing protein
MAGTVNLTIPLHGNEAERDDPRLIVLRPAGKSGADDAAALTIGSLGELDGVVVDPLAFCVDGWSAQEAAECAARIRRSPWWDRPILVTDHILPLADGVGGAVQARDWGERAWAARRSLAIDPASLYFDERLLYFLYLRHDAELVPALLKDSKTLYRYPMVDALAREGEDADVCLTTLMRRHLLEPVTLLDRTRHCRTCDSAHVHYLDVCPHCESLQIRKAQSLHCFACGHVGPEDTYFDGGKMVCPNCSVTLRHIGVDYDRPLTQYACGACHHVFVDTQVTTRCLDCGASFTPGELHVREISTLRLSPHGRAALRDGQIRESFAALDGVNCVEPAVFRRMLEWALASQQRDQDMPFSLMLVEFVNTAEFVDRVGAARLFLMLDEFARRLNEILRGSDLSTRTQEERLWLFLPWSKASGLAARLERALSGLTAGEEVSLHARLRFLQAPQEVRKGDTPEQLMTRLEESV